MNFKHAGGSADAFEVGLHVRTKETSASLATLPPCQQMKQIQGPVLQTEILPILLARRGSAGMMGARLEEMSAKPQ